MIYEKESKNIWINPEDIIIERDIQQFPVYINRDNMKKYHSPNFYRRFARNEICGTMTASAQPENCGIVHPTENRRFTIREVARIQTFPDDFIFIDDTARNITAMYKVLGNAVPVKMANAIALAIKQQVFKGDANNEYR